MSDMPIDIAALVDDDEELMFGEAVAPPPAAPDRVDTDSAPKAKKPKRAPKKGSGAAAQDAPAAAVEPTAPAAPATAAAGEPVDHPAPLPRPGDASAGSPVSEIPAGAQTPAKDRRGLLLGAALGLSVVTSFASLGGLIAVGHSLAALNAERAAAAEQTQAIARIARLAPVPMPAAEPAASPAPLAAPAPLPATAPGVTIDDLHHAVDDLKLTLARVPAAGAGSSLDATVQGGFVELNEHLSRIERQLDDQRPKVTVTPVRNGR